MLDTNRTEKNQIGYKPITRTKNIKIQEQVIDGQANAGTLSSQF